MPTYERHILFVDGDLETQETIINLLEPRGVKVITAQHGQTALRKIQKGLQPDIIIATLTLPDMDGFDFFLAIHNDPSLVNIPFIAISEKPEKSNYRRALTMGVDDILTKPIDEERLILTIYNRTKRTQELTRYAEAAHETLAYIRRDMARMFTHELRTPLVSLNMVLELLSRQPEGMNNEEGQEYIQTLQTGVNRLNRLVEQMVLLTQLDMGELEKLIIEAQRPGPLWDALTAAISTSRTFSHRQREVQVDYDQGGVQGDVMAEWKSLRHALAEILANAMAFSPKDETVVVTQKRDGKMVAISITDKGPGIPQDRMADLFRRFNQVERERHDQQGIGMGLYLAKSIIDMHGGSLELDTHEGVGTTITVRMPIIQ